MFCCKNGQKRQDIWSVFISFIVVIQSLLQNQEMNISLRLSAASFFFLWPLKSLRFSTFLDQHFYELGNCLMNVFFLGKKGLESVFTLFESWVNMSCLSVSADIPWDIEVKKLRQKTKRANKKVWLLASIRPLFCRANFFVSLKDVIVLYLILSLFFLTRAINKCHEVSR